MGIKNKDIIFKNKKVCTICNVACYNDGINIMNKFICENCVDKITLLNCGDIRYNKVKEIIKTTLVKNFKI